MLLQSFRLTKYQLLLLSVGAVSAILLSAKPAFSQAASGQVANAVTEMKSTMTALEGLAISGLAVALTPLGIRVGLRIVWHVLASA